MYINIDVNEERITKLRQRRAIFECCTLDGIVICFKDSHFSKDENSIIVTDDGMMTFLRFEHPIKDLEHILATEGRIMISINDEHLQKVLLSIWFTDEGIVISSSNWHSENEWKSIVLTFESSLKNWMVSFLEKVVSFFCKPDINILIWTESPIFFFHSNKISIYGILRII